MQEERYIIHACPERRWYVDQYLVPSMDGLDVQVCCDDNHIGNLESCMQIFRNMTGDGGTWHMQDDVMICRDFAERTKEHGDSIVCGFCVRKDDNMRYVGNTIPFRMWWSFPCIYIPNFLVRECADWFYRTATRKYAERIQTKKLDDWFFKKFLKIHYTNYPVVNLKPNLVDHIDYLLGGSVVNKERVRDVRSAFFEDKDLVRELERKIHEST